MACTPAPLATRTWTSLPWYCCTVFGAAEPMNATAPSTVTRSHVRSTICKLTDTPPTGELLVGGCVAVAGIGSGVGRSTVAVAGEVATRAGRVVEPSPGTALRIVPGLF